MGRPNKKRKRRSWRSSDTMNSTFTILFRNRAYSAGSISSHRMMTYSTGSTSRAGPLIRKTNLLLCGSRNLTKTGFIHSKSLSVKILLIIGKFSIMNCVFS